MTCHHCHRPYHGAVSGPCPHCGAWVKVAVTDAAFDLAAVAQSLKGYKDSFTAVTFEFPGVIHVYADGAVWVIGLANGPLGADYYESVDALEHGASPNRSIVIDIAFAVTPIAVAASIVDALSEGSL